MAGNIFYDLNCGNIFYEQIILSMKAVESDINPTILRRYVDASLFTFFMLRR